MKNTFEPFKNMRKSNYSSSHHIFRDRFTNKEYPLNTLCKNCKKSWGRHNFIHCPEEKGFITQIT